ncbi:MAG: exodeoxyribonuclease VII small subunit [Coriobacteriia bacterium]|nr:exodeoxyribonuclease VII small subunit [Coriobacteriia bacterium]MCL2750700.1 exodeoxyribonuclease VII small subunit [Coriobacteriia bacterium]
MPDTDSYSRERERLEEIVLQTRAKDVPLEKSLDLYDEALAIGTRCVEQLEKTDFTAEELDSLAENPQVEISGKVTEHPDVVAGAEGAGAAAVAAVDVADEADEDFEVDDDEDSAEEWVD